MSSQTQTQEFVGFAMDLWSTRCQNKQDDSKDGIQHKTYNTNSFKELVIVVHKTWYMNND